MTIAIIKINQGISVRRTEASMFGLGVEQVGLKLERSQTGRSTNRQTDRQTDKTCHLVLRFNYYMFENILKEGSAQVQGYTQSYHALTSTSLRFNTSLWSMQATGVCV